MEPQVVELVNPFEGGELLRLERVAWSAPVDNLGLIGAVDRLGERIVLEIATLLSDGSVPASARRLVYLIEAYCTPQSE